MKANTLLLTAFLLTNTAFTSTINLNQQSKSEVTPSKKASELMSINSQHPLVNKTAKTEEQSIDTWMPDKNLQNVVARNLRISVTEITPESMKKIVFLTAEGEGITDLTGFEYAINAYSISFKYNSIENLEPLMDLQALQVLLLTANKITDVSPLANLRDLKFLDVNSNLISQFPTDVVFQVLYGLTISGNQITEWKLNPLNFKRK